MIYGIKKFAHITLESITMVCVITRNFAEHIFNSKYSIVRSFANSAGKRVANKSRLKNRVQNLKDSMMKNAITNNSFVYMSKFWIGNEKPFVWSMLVFFTSQISCKIKDILLQIEFKFLHIIFSIFTFFKFLPSQKQVFGVRYFRK